MPIFWVIPATFAGGKPYSAAIWAPLKIFMPDIAVFGSALARRPLQHMQPIFSKPMKPTMSDFKDSGIETGETFL